MHVSNLSIIYRILHPASVDSLLEPHFLYLAAGSRFTFREAVGITCAVLGLRYPTQ